MELKLTDNQIISLKNAIENILLFEDLKIKEAFDYHLKHIKTTPENLQEIESLIIEGQKEAEDLFDWSDTPEYFLGLKNLLNKLNNNDFTFDENQMYNLRNVTDIYSRLGQGHIKAFRDVYSNIKNVHIGGFVSVTNIFDKASKITPKIAIQNLEEEYKVNYDIYQVIRNHLAWKRKPEGGVHVDFDKPLKYSKEPLPYINVEIPEEIQYKSKRSNKNKGKIKI
jgi:hypothetical protein